MELSSPLEILWDPLVEPVLHLARGTLAWLLAYLNKESEPLLTDAWFIGNYSIMMKISTFLLLPFLLLATIHAVAKGGLREVLRTYLIGMPVAILGCVVAISFITLCQRIDQNLVDAVIGCGGTNGCADSRDLSSPGTLNYHMLLWINELERNANSFQSLATSFVSVAALFIVAFLSFVLWIELIFRQIMIYLSVLFLPLAFATFVWSAWRQWLIMLIEVIVVMVFSKFLIAGVLNIGFAALMGGAAGGALGASENSHRAAMVIIGCMIIFLGSVAAPALITFIARPNFSIMSRKQVGAQSPIGMDRVETRQVVQQGVKSAAMKFKGK